MICTQIRNVEMMIAQTLVPRRPDVGPEACTRIYYSNGVDVIANASGLEIESLKLESSCRVLFMWNCSLVIDVCVSECQLDYSVEEKGRQSDGHNNERKERIPYKKSSDELFRKCRYYRFTCTIKIQKPIDADIRSITITMSRKAIPLPVTNR